MKRMCDLKDNLRGVRCDATKKAFRYLKKQGRKPYIDEPSPLVYYIRTQIDGQRYDYYPASGTWAPTKVRGKPGRWKDAVDAADFYEQACEVSAIRNSDEATDKQKAFIESLLEQTGAEPTEGATESKQGAIEEIERLLKIKTSQKAGYYKKQPEPVGRVKPRLSLEQWRALVLVCDENHSRRPFTISEIAIGLGTDKFRASTIVYILEKLQLIERRGAFIVPPLTMKHQKGEQA